MQRIEPPTSCVGDSACAGCLISRRSTHVHDGVRRPMPQTQTAASHRRQPARLLLARHTTWPRCRRRRRRRTCRGAPPPSAAPHGARRSKTPAPARGATSWCAQQRLRPRRRTCARTRPARGRTARNSRPHQQRRAQQPAQPPPRRIVEKVENMAQDGVLKRVPELQRCPPPPASAAEQEGGQHKQR